jgi:hypothetical protein
MEILSWYLVSLRHDPASWMFLLLTGNGPPKTTVQRSRFHCFSRNQRDSHGNFSDRSDSAVETSNTAAKKWCLVIGDPSTVVLSDCR